MPEVVIRRRARRRKGSVSEQIERWYARNRPQAVVILAAAVACGGGLIFSAIGVVAANHGPSEQSDTQTLVSP